MLPPPLQQVVEHRHQSSLTHSSEVLDVLCYCASTKAVVNRRVVGPPAARQQQGRTGETSIKVAEDESGSDEYIQSQANELTHCVLDNRVQLGQEGHVFERGDWCGGQEHFSLLLRRHAQKPVHECLAVVQVPVAARRDTCVAFGHVLLKKRPCLDAGDG